MGRIAVAEVDQPLTARLEGVIRPLLEADGFDLVLLEYISRSKILRLYIDHPEGIKLDDCGRVSHRVGDLLDAEGLVDGQGGIDGQYTLEVSSPGLDRPLVRPAHFQRFVGHNVQLATRRAVRDDGRRKLSGKLVAADEQGICIETEGQPLMLAYDTIERARLVPEL